MDYVEKVNLENKRRLQALLEELPKFCSDFFGNSLGRFLAAFSGGQKLSDKDAEELRAYLDQYEKDKH